MTVRIQLTLDSTNPPRFRREIVPSPSLAEVKHQSFPMSDCRLHRGSSAGIGIEKSNHASKRSICLKLTFSLLLFYSYLSPTFAQDNLPNQTRGQLTGIIGHSQTTASALGFKTKLLNSKRVVFLGDSNTYAGEWINQVEATLLATQDSVPEFINLGLPSETCSGFSEPAHPFPRPNVQERLLRALKKTKPDLVFACYGMNDGIYHPFAEERFEGFKTGIQKIVDSASAANIPLILLTPPPFDALPMRKAGGLVPLDSKQFLWTKIYENYDSEVIERYAQWMLEINNANCFVIDVHSPIKNFLNEKRKAKPEFSFSKDGVHFDNAGHRVFAKIVLQRLNFDKSLPNTSPQQNELLQLVRQRQKINQLAWLADVGHLRPGVPAGLPLGEASQKTKSISDKIRQLSK